MARVPTPAARQHGPARAELARLLRACSTERPTDIAAFLGIDRSGPSRASTREQRWMAPYLTALDDPRFPPLEASDRAIRRYAPWRRLRDLHGAAPGPPR